MSLIDTRARILDLKITFRCNNTCLFCVAGDKRLLFSDIPAKDIRAALAENRGVRDTVIFTGGEPTIREDLPELVRYAREKCGYETIVIQTNGRALAYRDYAELLVGNGANQFMVSIHAHTPAAHDFLTGRSGSFAQTAGGISNLVSIGATVATNTVITKSTYRNLPDIARLIVLLGARQMQFAYPHLDGRAAVNAARIAPPMTLVIPYLLRALETAEHAGRVALTEGFPLCMLPGREGLALETLHKKIKVIDEGGGIDDFDGHRATKLKAKGPHCPPCRHFAMCEGPWDDYPKLYGWREFIPVKSPPPPRNKRKPHSK